MWRFPLSSFLSFPKLWLVLPARSAQEWHSFPISHLHNLILRLVMFWPPEVSLDVPPDSSLLYISQCLLYLCPIYPHYFRISSPPALASPPALRPSYYLCTLPHMSNSFSYLRLISIHTIPQSRRKPSRSGYWDRPSGLLLYTCVYLHASRFTYAYECTKGEWISEFTLEGFSCCWLPWTPEQAENRFYIYISV